MDQMHIYMPCIYWHDRQGILSIDVFQQPATKDDNGNSVYKIATASMQKEIRVWNFRFEPIQPQKQREPKVTSVSAGSKTPSTKTITAADEKEKKEKQQEDEEDSIVCLDGPQKENVKSKVGTETGKMEESEVKNEPVEGDEMDVQSLPNEAEEKGQIEAPKQTMAFDFLSNMEGHRLTTNIVRFSPNGTYIASGDAEGCIIVWKMERNSQVDEDAMELDERRKAEIAKKPAKVADSETKQGDPEMDLPPNRECWVRAFRQPIRHGEDVTGLCWSPDSLLIASVAMDDTIAVHRADTGKRLFTRSHRHFANGIVWDPRGKYLITLSTDRRMDVLDAQKGNRLRCCHQIVLPETPLPQSDGVSIAKQSYKVFHDDQLPSFQRGVEFSPCGSIIFAPAVHLEVGANNIYGTFAFLRADLKHCRPTALFPTLKPTIQLKCSPIIYELFDGPNFLGLSHRLIFAVLCRDSVLLYSSQNESPIAYMENFQYDKLTSLAWTPDGRVLVVSSMEGFNSFITVDPKKLGTPLKQQQAEFILSMQLQHQQLGDSAGIKEHQTKTPTKTEETAPASADVTPKPTPQHQPIAPSLPDSPKLITPRRPRAKKAVLNNTPAVAPSSVTAADGGGTQKQTMEGNLAEKRSINESPKTIIPRKKPKKVQTIPVPTSNIPSNKQ